MIRVIDMEVQLPKDHCWDIMSKIFRMLDKPNLCDISIVIEEQIFWAHKCVLIAACPTLYDIVLKEAENSQKNNLQFTLHGLTCGGFDALLTYIYTGVAPDASNLDLFSEFKKACHALGVNLGQSKKERSDPDFGSFTGTSLSEKPSIFPENLKVIIEITTSHEDDFQFNDAESELKNKSNSGDVTEDETIAYTQGIIEDLMNYKDNGFDINSLFSVTKRQLVPKSFFNNDDNSAEANFGSKIEDKNSTHDHEPAEEEVTDEAALPICHDTESSVQSDGCHVQSSASTLRTKVKTEVSDIPTRRRGGRPRLPYDHIFPAKPPFICPFSGCEKICETREKLKKHYRNHSEKTHKCDICGRKFLYRKDLPIHMRIHTGERPYQCATCEKSFTQKSTLKLHIATHSRSGDMPKFPCRNCPKVYTSHRALSQHIKEKHSEASLSKFACKRCGKDYKTHALLLEHTKSICNTTFYLCAKCGVQYKKKDCYENHVKICDGAVEYRCGLCGNVFKHRKAIENHIQSVHGVYPVKPETMVPVHLSTEDTYDGQGVSYQNTTTDSPRDDVDFSNLMLNMEVDG